MRCVKIEYVESDSDLYDLEIDGGNNNYIAEGIVVHNTWCMIGLVPERMQHPEHGRLIVSSKGLSARGLAIKPNAEANKTNLYVRVAKYLNLEEKLQNLFKETLSPSGLLPGDAHPAPVFVLGETFGRGVQDLSYGANTDTNDDIGFRVFDIFVGFPTSGLTQSRGRYLNDDELDRACVNLGLERVPVLYRGPFSKKVMLECTNGYETVSGKQLHIREGIVVRPTKERYCDEIGRLQLKSVSGDYLTRKGRNVTEYQ